MVFEGKAFLGVSKYGVTYLQINIERQTDKLAANKSQQSESNSSGSKTHKSQELGLMAHQHRQKARSHLDGSSLVL